MFSDNVKARRPGTRDRLGVENEMIYQGDAISLIDSTDLTDKLGEQV